MSQTDAKNKLIDAGATCEKREDRYGVTRSGWWLDGVYLGKDARTAVEAVQG